MVFLPIEVFFLYSNLHKVPEGGWIALALGGGVAVIMGIWLWGERVKRRFGDYVEFSPYIDRLVALSEENTLPYFATHLVCLTTSPTAEKLEHRLLYVLLQRQPKRARTYWFVHVAVSEAPYTATYQLHTYVPGKLYRVVFHLGFKLQPRIGLLLRQVVTELAERGEIDLLTPYPKLRAHRVQGDFRFLFVRRVINWDGRFSPRERLALQLYQLLDRLSLPVENAYGLDVASLAQERVPLTTPEIPPELRLRKSAA